MTIDTEEKSRSTARKYSKQEFNIRPLASAKNASGTASSFFKDFRPEVFRK